jgi:predicted SprT family Zn-dependent metalloprotease
MDQAHLQPRSSPRADRWKREAFPYFWTVCRETIERERRSERWRKEEAVYAILSMLGI